MTTPDDDLRDRIRGHLDRERIDLSYVQFVLQHLHDRDDAWRYCCGSQCDPCAKQLNRVVDAVRCELGLRS